MLTSRESKGGDVPGPESTASPKTKNVSDSKSNRARTVVITQEFVDYDQKGERSKTLRASFETELKNKIDTYNSIQWEIDFTLQSLNSNDLKRKLIFLNQELGKTEKNT